MSLTEITSEHLEAAEKALQRTYNIAVGANAVDRVLHRARIDLEAGERFMSYHKTLLFKQYLPDIDPRHEPAIMTMFLHMLAVGAVAQRLADGRPA